MKCTYIACIVFTTSLQSLKPKLNEAINEIYQMLPSFFLTKIASRFCFESVSTHLN